MKELTRKEKLSEIIASEVEKVDALIKEYGEVSDQQLLKYYVEEIPTSLSKYEKVRKLGIKVEGRKMNKLHELYAEEIQLITDFITEEYDDEFDAEETFKDLHEVSIAYTTNDDEEEIQVSVDIINQRIIIEEGEDKVYIMQDDDHDEFIDTLKHLDFHHLTQSYNW